jgi:hypothetical protein
MKKYKWLTFLIPIILFSYLAFDNVAYAKNKEVKVVYFYINACESCSETQIFLKQFEGIDIPKIKGIDIKYEMYNMYHSGSYGLMQKYFNAFKVPLQDQKVPIIFIGNTYLAGDDAIKAHLKDEIIKGNQTLDITNGKKDDSSALKQFSGMKLFNVFGAGLINGFNPCALSMLLLFISILVMKGIDVIKVGIAFCLGKFVSYLALGTLLFNLLIQLNIAWYKPVLKIIMTLIVIAIVAFNLSDYFAAKTYSIVAR